MFDREKRMLVRHYLEQGVAKAEIARRLKIGRRTVYKWMAADEKLKQGACEDEYGPRPSRPTKLDRFKEIVQQEALVGLCDPLNRVAAISTGMWGWDPPGGSQQVQQLAAGRRIAESSLLRLANGMECHDLIVIEIIDSQLLRREPTAHISSQMQFLPSRRGCVAFGCEPDSECVDIVG